MKITKGDWESSDVVVCKSPYDDHVQVDHLEYPNANRGIIIARFYGHDMKANADIAAEAGTVHNDTGYTPRELAEQKKALLDACEALVKWNKGKLGGAENILPELVKLKVILKQTEAAIATCY